MSNYNSLKATINANIKANGNQEITGPVLQSVLTQIVNSLGANYQLVGIATPQTNPGTPDQNVAYIAGQGGVYSYFDGFEVADNQIVIFKYNGDWSHQLVTTIDVGLEVSLQYGKNLYNEAATTQGYINSRTGNAVALDSGGYYYTDYIPIDSRGLYAGNSVTYGVVGGYAIYDKYKNYIRGVRTSPKVVTYQDGDAWVRFTIIKSASAYEQQINVGTTLDSPIVPYVAPSVHITTPNFQILPEQIPNGSIDTSKIADKAVTISKFEPTITIYSKNLLDTSRIVTNKWINATGGVAQVNASYGHFPYIEVLPETAYHISNSSDQSLSNRSDAYIAFYDENSTFISSIASNVTQFTTPVGCKYVRISVTVSRVTQAQMEIGTMRTAYEEYFAPKEYIDPEIIMFPDGGVTTLKIANGAITQEKIAAGVSLPASPAQFGSLRNSGTLTAGQSLTTPRVRVVKNTRIVANIRGTIESVEVGVARLGFYGRWVEITPTKIIVKYGSSASVAAEYDHGLTLGTKTKVIISKTISASSLVSATIRLIDDYGNTYSSPSVTWSPIGDVFVYNGNASASIDAEISFMVADITKQIWLFGDSYLSFTDPARWLHYPLTWGYLSYLVDAIGGETATQAFADLQNLLSTGAVPSMIVWCLGMNGGADTSGGAVNSTWLSITTQLETLCQQYGITLIMATIPSVPSQIHTALNNWVRNSGHRYIDFAAAVEESNSYYWRGWGTANALLSSDEVHPTSHGAVELAMRALLDFPEMMVKEN